MSDDTRTSPDAPNPPNSSDLQQQVDTLHRQLSASQRELEAFVYAVSHDLRAPLRSLSGFSQALLEMSQATPNNGLDAKAQHYLNRIQQASSKLSEMIDALLSLSRISRAEVHMRSLDFSQLCTDAAQGMRSKYAPREIQFEIEPGMTIQGDARLMRQALDALLDNACKFTAERTSAHIAVRRFNSNEGAGFCVQDNGIGFDMSYVGKLFQPFQRLHADERYAGQGLGLATAQRVIARHGGQVGAQSTPNGTTVFCNLPS